MFKIKKDKHRKRFEILEFDVPVFSCSVERFVDLANAVVKYVVGKDYIISSPDRQATANGYGKYHFIKGFLLAGWHDVKKKYAIGRNRSCKECDEYEESHAKGCKKQKNHVGHCIESGTSFSISDGK